MLRPKVRLQHDRTLDERWGVTTSVYIPERAKQMVWLAGHLAYEAAAEAFERIAHWAIPPSAIWNETQRHGERLKAYVAHRQAQVAVERLN